jgi:hypothetical protein
MAYTIIKHPFCTVETLVDIVRAQGAEVEGVSLTSKGNLKVQTSRSLSSQELVRGAVKALLAGWVFDKIENIME